VPTFNKVVGPCPSLSLQELVDIEHSLIGQKIILMGQILTAFEILVTKPICDKY